MLLLHLSHSISLSKYGGTAPCVHTMPNQYHGRVNKFTANLAAAGNYTYNGLNTELDKSVV